MLWDGSARCGAVGAAFLPSAARVVPCRAAKISEEHREKFRFDKFVVVAPCDEAGGAAGSGPAMLSDFYFSKFDDEALLQVRFFFVSARGVLRSRFVVHVSFTSVAFVQPGYRTP